MELILQVKLERNKRVVDESIIAYTLRGELYLQLPPILWALELPAIEQDNLITAGCHVPAEEAYIRKDLIERLIGARLHLDMPRMAVVISSDMLFPIEQRIKREKRWAKRPLAHRNEIDRDAITLDSPYQWAEFPTASINLRSTHDLEANDNDVRYDVRFRGDLLKASADFLVVGGTQQSGYYTGSLFRYDPDGKLLGPLGATHARLGDVSGLRDGLVGRGRVGRGGVLSNRRTYHSGRFGTDALTGVLEPGWSVELYRGNVLLDVQRASETGRYEFQDVELDYGSNNFKLVFYGPTGETRTEIITNNVNANQLKAGDVRYDLVAYENDRSINGNRTVPFGRLGLYGQWVQSSLEVGLAKNLSQGLGYSWFEDSDTGVHRAFVSSSLNAKTSGSSSLLLRGVYELETSESGWEAGFIGSAGGKHYSLEHKAFNGLATEWSLAKGADLLLEESAARLSWGVPSWWGAPSFNLRLERERYESGRTYLNLRSRSTIRLARWAITDEVTVSRTESTGTAETINNQFRLRRNFGRWNFRMDLRHRLEPESKLINGGFDLDYRYTNKLRYGLSIDYNEMARDTNYSVNTSYRGERFNTGLNVGCRTQSSCSAFLSVRFLVGKRPASSGFYLNNGDIGRKGLVVAEAFHDINANGLRDANEPVVDGVELSTRGNRKRALVAGGLPLPEKRYQTLSVHEKDVESPFMYSTVKRFNVLPRAGHRQVVPIAMVETAEIDGSLIIGAGSVTKQVPGVRVQAISSNGEVQSEVRSAYDGFFVIERLPLGDYKVRIHPDDAKKFKLVSELGVGGGLKKPGDMVSLGEVLVNEKDSSPEKPLADGASQITNVIAIAKTRTRSGIGQPQELKQIMITNYGSVEFAEGAETIGYDLGQMNRLVAITSRLKAELNKNTDAQFVLHGYFDESGQGEVYNRLVATRRALAVKEALSRLGVPEFRFGYFITVVPDGGVKTHNINVVGWH